MKGRKEKELPSNYKEVVESYYAKEITVEETLKQLKISKTKFYKILHQENKLRKNKIENLSKTHTIEELNNMSEEINVSKRAIYNYFKKSGKKKYLVEFNGEKEYLSTLKEITYKYKIDSRTLKRHLEGKKTKLDKKGIKVEKQ